ncbi:TetR/AcrR family transcriptional regulator C-terminal domain-containing protein [Actinoplanes sp. NBRC 103695]|uniref:TetR/AcrR family transcriptional regulator n=1 Tax=Actinoplanes sp. NBRC 103695 TaxID=3032202 RepID=UPI003319F6B4
MTRPGSETARRSRRERPAKPALTRQGIIDAGLGILSAEGLAKVTMRRIAGVLDTGHASLYVYVRDTEDLHAQILDALLATVKFPSSGNWRTRLKDLLTGYGEVLRNHAELARMALSTQPNGPHFTAIVEQVLALLKEGGADDRSAAWGVDLLLLVPTALAVEHSAEVSPRLEAERLSDMETRIQTVDPQQYPNIARLSADLVAGGGLIRSLWALDVVVDGILARTAANRMQ